MVEEGQELDRQFIPSLREGRYGTDDFFKKMKEYLSEKYPDEDGPHAGMLAAAVMNELFGTPNPEPRFAQFSLDQASRIQEELTLVASSCAELRIPLTDALRIHFLCNVQEGIDGDEAPVLAKAQELGVLIAERDVPLPKGFMELVHRLGKAYGFIHSD